MKTIIASITFAVFVFAAGVANSHTTLVDEHGHQIKGNVYATCTVGFREGRKFSTVTTVDRSHDQIPAPRSGSTCAEYTAELMKLGAQVDQSLGTCITGGPDDLLPPEIDWACILVLVALVHSHPL